MWNSFDDFLAMGGYGLYVWGSLVVCIMVCVIEPVMLVLRRRALIAEAAAQDTSDTGKSFL